MRPNSPVLKWRGKAQSSYENIPGVLPYRCLAMQQIQQTQQQPQQNNNNNRTTDTTATNIMDRFGVIGRALRRDPWIGTRAVRLDPRSCLKEKLYRREGAKKPESGAARLTIPTFCWFNRCKSIAMGIADVSEQNLSESFSSTWVAHASSTPDPGIWLGRMRITMSQRTSRKPSGGFSGSEARAAALWQPTFCFDGRRAHSTLSRGDPHLSSLKEQTFISMSFYPTPFDAQNINLSVCSLIAKEKIINHAHCLFNTGEPKGQANNTTNTPRDFNPHSSLHQADRVSVRPPPGRRRDKPCQDLSHLTEPRTSFWSKVQVYPYPHRWWRSL